ncbi:acyl-CoA carboxylase subunit beta [Dietzia kunjamensis]|uniref:acyl-CoA carboxylase subunit beta n=1 Tax=Dietzia kunjamensis TaxID=322509 RepID=UPI0033660A29
MSTKFSSLDTRSAEYAENRAAMLAALKEIEMLQQQAQVAGGEKYIARHRGRGRLLVRERIELLVDRGSAFLELSTLAGHGAGDPLGGGCVTGIGVVEGTEVMIVGNDGTVRGGSQSPSTVKKILRAYEIARINKLPLINLVESAGADLPRQSETFVPGGATFKEISRLSGAGVTTIAVVFGSSTAGGAYVPGMSDYTIFVKGQAQVFLGGPPLVKMATDEDADEEELGGAEMHARTSGLADYLAADEFEAVRMTRDLVRNLGEIRPHAITEAGEEPLFDSEELLGIPSANPRVPYDIREVIIRVVDGSRFDEFKPAYGANLVCGWATLAGRRIGILANNGILFSEEAQKGAHFIQLANQSRTPLLFVHNITGFMVGTRYEQGGIIKDGAKLINAVSNSSVPHLTLMVGASYGAGNYAMSGRAYDPRFVFTWPSHRVAVMGGKQLAGVLSIVRRNAAEKSGTDFDEAADAERKAAVEDQIDRESTALFATGHLWDDGVIDPRDTRTVLSIALSAAVGAGDTEPKNFAVFRM